MRDDEATWLETFHVLPTFRDEPRHDASTTCWCEPEQDREEPRLWIHKRTQ